MVSIDDAILARYSKDGKHFEILVDPEKAIAFRDGKIDNVVEVLAVEEVFKDARKGDRAGDGNLEEIFETTDHMEAAKQILLHGEIQLTTEQRKKKVEDRKKEIITIISRESHNPQTNAPHPPQRIETAIEEAGVHVDPFVKAEDQLESVVNSLRPLLPISMERLRIEVTVPPAYTGKVYSILKKYNLEKEDWLNDGSLKAHVVIPAGIESDFYDEINGMTHAETQFKRINN